MRGEIGPRHGEDEQGEVWGDMKMAKNRTVVGPEGIPMEV